MLVAAAAAYLLCYGGVRGPVDWLDGRSVHRGPGQRRRIALTFDDGPHRVHTPALLDALAALAAPATFFVVGAAVDANPALCRRMVAAGHELGNHTYTHRYLPLRSQARLTRELAFTDRAIEDATGVSTSLVRPPWGGRSPWTLRALAAQGKRAVLWDVNPFDWRGASADELTARVARRVRPGSIVLMHEARDRGDVTVAAVRQLVPRLRADGYELVTVSALLAGGAAA